MANGKSHPNAGWVSLKVGVGVISFSLSIDDEMTVLKS